MKISEDALFDARRTVEKGERWREIMDSIPALSFPADAKVKIIPPFSGAVARFTVERGNAFVSIFADFHDVLTTAGEPVRSMYSRGQTDGDEVFPIGDGEALSAALAASLDAQQAPETALPAIPQP